MAYLVRMLTTEVLAHYGTKTAIARALGIGKAAVSAWGDRVPPLRAAQLAALNPRHLKFDPNDYRDWYSPGRR